jgi:anhydro-N-acetylmuramic acid kinase
MGQSLPQSSPKSPVILGMMSGTSADGVDVVLLELEGFPPLGHGGTRAPRLEDLNQSVPRGNILAQHYHPSFRTPPIT